MIIAIMKVLLFQIVGPRDGIERAAAHIIKVSAEQVELASLQQISEFWRVLKAI